MHELSLAQRMIAIMCDTAREHGGQRVIAARLILGALTAVEPETLKFAFEIASRDTCAAGCKLEIVKVPLRLRCRRCAHVHEAEDLLIPCPACQAQGHEIVEGRELRLESIEIDEPSSEEKIP